ncbi:hypothetical protein JHK87_044892 [Glycine soja]|nr:hypothetical protein JHK87_044892 [Glycine soja]
MRRFKETEDCFIVGFDPSAAAVPLLVDSSANDVSVIAEKGQICSLGVNMSIEYLPSKIYFFSKDEGTHDGYDNHHQRAESTIDSKAGSVLMVVAAIHSKAS